MRELKDGLPFDDYNAAKALSAHGAHALIQQCPRAYWWNSPYNPERPVEESTTFDVGTAAHLAVLEPDALAERIVVIPEESYRTKAAQEARDGARLAGKVPLLTKFLETVEAIARSLAEHPLARPLLAGAVTERSYFWTDPRSGAPCKARVDCLPANGAALIDLKTTHSANPRVFARTAYDCGYVQQLAWHCDGVEVVGGTRPRHGFLIAVEREAPYLVAVYRFTDRAMEWGRILNAKARETFAACLAKGEWPAYDTAVQDLELPSYAEFGLEDRQAAGEFQLAEHAAAFDLQRP